MRRFHLGRALVMAGILAGQAGAQPFVPPPGSELRRALLDTVRPMAEYELGAPVAFIVLEMLAEGDVAFARLMPQRPGGAPIDIETTPMVVLRGESPDAFDGPRIEVFYERTAGQWDVVILAIGATDAWWYCYRPEHYGAFFPDRAC